MLGRSAEGGVGFVRVKRRAGSLELFAATNVRIVFPPGGGKERGGP